MEIKVEEEEEFFVLFLFFKVEMFFFEIVDKRFVMFFILVCNFVCVLGYG